MTIRALSRQDAVNLAGATVALATTDQLVKWAAFATVANNGAIQLLPVLTITSGMNSGVTFGLGTGVAPTALVIVAIAVCVGLVVLISGSKSVFRKLAAGAIIGGALGNVLDRIRFGAVRDFIDVHWDAWHWPAFNLADAFIVVGVVALLIAPESAAKQAPSKSPARRG